MKPSPNAIDATEWLDVGATFSADRRHRTRLWRRWAPGPACAFVMLNPSTADERVLDPTVRRCVGFARAWGFGRLDVVNIFALRSTDPRALYDTTAADAVGRGNDRAIGDAAAAAQLVVCAWGAHGALHARGDRVRALLERRALQPHALRVTKDGHPAHPLYLPAALRPIRLIAGGA